MTGSKGQTGSSAQVPRPPRLAEQGHGADAQERAAHAWRVCQAWHRACGVHPTPGISGAEGEEKGKGVIGRWRLEEAQSKGAGRRTGTGQEVWYTWNEWAPDHEVLHPRVGVLYKSGAYARTVLCLTLGDLHAVRASEEAEAN